MTCMHLRCFSRNGLQSPIGMLESDTAFVAAGFQNLATEELCARWIAVGAWQPLARVHHAQSFQELYR